MSFVSADEESKPSFNNGIAKQDASLVKLDRHQPKQNQPDPEYVGHYKHKKQLERNLPDPHGDRDSHGEQSHEQHEGHDKHAGHTPGIFKRRFFICLLLTLPVLYFSPMFQHWFSYQAIQFSGANWITPVLSTIIYFYGGWVLFSSWAVSAIVRSRDWVLRLTPRLTFLFTSIGLLITLAIETYRVNSKTYGVPILAVPILGMSFLAVIQWIILPPFILYLARRHRVGYPKNRSLDNS